MSARPAPKAPRPRRLALLAAALALAACQAEAPRAKAPPRRWILAQAPRGTAGALPEPATRLPPGSRLVAVDPDRPEAEPVLLSGSMAAAGEARLSPRAGRLLFLGREGGADAFALWTCNLDGSERRKVVAREDGLGAGAFLPDGRIVYAAPRPGSPPWPGLASAWALFVAPGDGSPGRRITFSGGVDVDPSVLGDGRVLYASWRPGTAGGDAALFTVHPDGTGVALFHGPAKGAQARHGAREGPDGTVFLTERRGEGPGSLAAVDGQDTFAPSRPLPSLPAGQVASVWPTRGGDLLVALLPWRGAGGGLYRVDPDGGAAEGPLFFDPQWDVVQAVEVAPFPAVQGHLSMVDPSRSHGHLFCVDARPEGRLEGTHVRLAAVEGALVGTDPAGRALGTAPLESDGSFYLRVPPDVPLRLEVVDAEGRVLERTSTPFWVRPNEVRGCIGCHEPRDEAPPNVRPRAVTREPVALGVEAEDGDR